MTSAARWSRRHDACRDCRTVDRPHKARGYCGPCYRARYRAGELVGTFPHGDSLWAVEEGRRHAQQLADEVLADDLWRDRNAGAVSPGVPA